MLVQSRRHVLGRPWPAGGALHLVPGSARLYDVTHADGWDKQSGVMRFNGYLVTLDVTPRTG
jgi:hypothetical protein